MFREWLSAAATSAGFFTGMTYWHELPTRQAAILHKTSTGKDPRATKSAEEFVPTFKAAAD